jgi:hypothetical protein
MTSPARKDGRALPPGSRSGQDDAPPPRVLTLRGEPLRGGAETTPPGELLAALVEEVTAVQSQDKAGPVRVVIDIEGLSISNDRMPIDGGHLCRLVEPLLRRSIRATADCSLLHARRREVVITTIAHADVIEIEVADSAGMLSAGERAGLRWSPQGTWERERGENSPLNEVSRQARSLGGSLTGMDCPDGGIALTLRLPLHRTARRRAA